MVTLLATAAAFLVTVLTTPLVRRLALELGAVDRAGPDGLHGADTPRLGGLAIFIGFATALWAVEPDQLALVGGGFVMLALGGIDDRWRLSARHKLPVQIAVAAFAWWAGVRVEPAISLPDSISCGLTILWLVGVTNAINLMDGLDGLVSGISLVVLASISACALLRHDDASLALALPLGGAIAGFWIHNRHPAKIFLGDAGSLLVGYLLAAFMARSTHEAATPATALMPVVALALPLFDTALAVARRLAAGGPVLEGDLDHVHHRLLASGWPRPKAVRFLHLVTLAFNALAVLLVWTSDWRAHALVLGVAVALLTGVSRFFRSTENDTRRSVRTGAHRSRL
jgi:UDP-GlcNAc:undecaprenyl-phosphate GlcNAc-1-phosphate transferase